MKKIFTTLSLLFIVGIVSAQFRIYTPEIVSPIGGVLNEDPGALLDWNAVTGSTNTITYQVRLNDSPDFTDPIIDEITEYTSYKCSGLLFGTTYYWQVRATDGVETSAWSEPGVFTTTKFVYTTLPGGFANNQNPDALIRWDQLSGASVVEIQVDTVYDWEKMPVTSTSNFQDVFVLDDSNAWTIGSEGVIMHFDGTEWLDQTSGTDKILRSIFMNSQDAGWAVGNTGTVLKYTSGTWSVDSAVVNDSVNELSNLYSVFMLDEATGFLAGESGYIHKYDGTSWGNPDSTGKQITSLFFIDANTGWATCADGSLLKYNGTEWTLEFTADKKLNDISMLNENFGFAVGLNGGIYEYNGTEWMKNELLVSRTNFNREFTSVLVMSENKAYGTSKNGFLMEYDGEFWYPNSGINAVNYNAVSFSSEENGMIAGQSATLLNFTDNFYSSPFANTLYLDTEDNEANFNELYFDKHYYWRIRAFIGSQDSTYWSPVKSFTTFATVELDKPVNNATGIDLYLFLEYNKDITGVEGFDIEIDEDEAFGDPLKLKSDSASAELFLYYFDVKYFWRVKAYHGRDTTEWSDVYNFTTIDHVPLKKPNNGEEDVERKPTFIWDSVGAVKGYQLQYNTSDEWTDPVGNFIFDSTAKKYDVQDRFPEGATVYWRMRTFSSFNRDTTEWGEPWTFKILGAIGVVEYKFADNVQLFPNPSNGLMNIEINMNNAAEIRLNVMDLLGKTFIRKEFAGQNGLFRETVDLENLSNGIYIIRLEKEGQIYTDKIILDR